MLLNLDGKYISKIIRMFFQKNTKEGKKFI